MSQHIKLIAGLIVAVCLASPSKADSLIGKSIQVDYRFPNSTTSYGTVSAPNPFTVVDPGVEAIINIEDVTWLHIDFDPNSLLITLETTLGSPTWATVYQGQPVTQNGPIFSIIGSFPAISSVSSTGTTGLSPSAFLSSGVLFVNWAGMTYHDGDTVTVSFAPVPLPAALPLFGGGLLALAWLGRRKKRDTA